MERRLYEVSALSWDCQPVPLLQHAPCGFDNPQVVVDRSKPMFAGRFAFRIDVRGKVTDVRGEHDCSWAFETVRPVGSHVPVEPSQTLKQHVHGAEIGQHQVRVQVQALLHSLGGHSYTPALRPVLSDASFEGLVEGHAITACEAGMVGRGSSPDAEE